MWRCSFWAIDTMLPERSKIRHRDDAVPWSIAATYRPVIGRIDSPGDRAQLMRYGPGALADVSDEVTARLTSGQQPLRRPEDAHRAHRSPGTVGDRRGDRPLPGVELADLGRPAALHDPTELPLQALGI